MKVFAEASLCCCEALWVLKPAEMAHWHIKPHIPASCVSAAASWDKIHNNNNPARQQHVVMTLDSICIAVFVAVYSVKRKNAYGHIWYEQLRYPVWTVSRLDRTESDLGDSLNEAKCLLWCLWSIICGCSAVSNVFWVIVRWLVVSFSFIYAQV